jgi:hypothetical protein
VRSDRVIVVADGPGNLGTDTTWGVSALASGHALAAARTLRGRPVAALRVSFADPRERHHGLSHHSVTILRDVCTVDVNVRSLRSTTPIGRSWGRAASASLEDRHQLGRLTDAGLEELASVEVADGARCPRRRPAFFPPRRRGRMAGDGRRVTPLPGPEPIAASSRRATTTSRSGCRSLLARGDPASASSGSGHRAFSRHQSQTP